MLAYCVSDYSNLLVLYTGKKLTNNIRKDTSMPGISDLLDTISQPSFCMRKNGRPLDAIKDDLNILVGLFALYVSSYAFGLHRICLITMLAMYVVIYQIVQNYRLLQSRVIHQDNFDELNSSTSSDVSELEPTEELSIKQREQGAVYSRGMSEDQEWRVLEQLEQVVQETEERNAARAQGETEFDDLPDLIPLDNDDMPPLVPIYSLKPNHFSSESIYSNLPNLSEI